MIYIASNIKYLRTKCRMTQNSLGECSGASRSSIGFYESKRTEPSYDTIVKIAKTLGVTVHELVTEDLKLKSNGK